MSTVPVAHLATTADLIAAVPYLLGFVPADSMVTIGLQHGRIQMTARMDLDDLAEASAAPHVLSALVRAGSSDAIVISYGTTHAPVAAITAAATAAGIQVTEQLHVRDGRYRSLLCTDPHCCPPSGHIIPASSAVPPQLVVSGLVARPDRQTLADTITPAADRQTMTELVCAAESHRAAAALRNRTPTVADCTRRIRRAAAHLDALDDTTAAQVAVSLRTPAVRDAIWLAIDADTIDVVNLAHHLNRTLPDSHRAAPLFLLAWIAWRSGNGALALIAATEADAVEPGYSAARLLLDALASGLDPRTTPKLHQLS